jgi:biopolymer transport protein TolR
VAATLMTNGRAGNGRRRYRPMSDINVTPLVDVMLVLLIVFMVTAPLLTVGVPVDLPKTEAAQLTDQIEPLVVSVDARGKLFLQETELEREQLVPRLKAITGAKPDTRIFVRGDKTIAYGEVMTVMGMISAAGFSKVALLAELPQPAPSRQRR